eukprot:s1794_g24.t1
MTSFYPSGRDGGRDEDRDRDRERDRRPRSPSRGKGDDDEEAESLRVCPHCDSTEWRMSRKGNWTCAKCNKPWEGETPRASEKPRTPQPVPEAPPKGFARKSKAKPKETGGYEEDSEYTYDYETETDFEEEDEEEPPRTKRPSKAEAPSKKVSRETKVRDDKRVPVDPPRRRSTAERAEREADLARKRQIAADAQLAARIAEKNYTADFGEDPPVRDSAARGSGIPRDADGPPLPVPPTEPPGRPRPKVPPARREDATRPSPPRASPPRSERNRGRSRRRRTADEEPNKKKRRKTEHREESEDPGSGQTKGKGGDKGKGKKGSKGKDRKGYWTFSDDWGWIWATFNTKSEKGARARERSDKGKSKGKGKTKNKSKKGTRRKPGSAERTRAAKGHGREPTELPPSDEDIDPGEEAYRRESRRSPPGGGHDDDDDDGEDDDDDGGGSGWEAYEEPEEETPTNDPTIEPSPPASLAGSNRLPQVGEAPPPPANQRPGSLGGGTPARRSLRSSSASLDTWDERKGPAPGIKWRGGRPPDPPAFEHNPRDLRSYPQWERKVRLWESRVSNWLPPREAALLLLESLTGQAELETEHLQLERVGQADGITYLLGELRQTLGERTLYLKRLYLQEWEVIARQQNESVRGYTNRFKRILLDLRSQEIGLETSFTSETIGYRLLERAKLSPDQARLVLVGSNQSFAYEAIRESLILQFPEGKAPPPIFGAPPQQGTRPAGKGQPAPQGKGASKGRGNYTSQPRPRLVNAAEQEDEEAAAGQEEDQPDGDEEEEGDAEDDMSELTEHLEALSVTTDKLKAITQARRFGTPSKGGSKGAPKPKAAAANVAQKKAASTCRICGQTGHWARECPKNKGGQPSRVQVTEEVAEGEEEQHESFFAFPTEVMDHVSIIPGVPEVYLASAQTSAGHMVLDTACQKLCAGKTWCSSHEELLNQLSLWSVREPTSERFRFGAGPVQQATEKVLLPCVLQGKPLVLRTCELQAEVPLLGSLTLLTTLGATIDLLQRQVYFQKLGVAVPLVRLANRHIAVNILQMETLDGPFPAEFHLWSSTTDELALQPGDAPRQKAATQHYRLDDEEVEPGEHFTFPIEAEYEFGSQSLGSSTSYRRDTPEPCDGPPHDQRTAASMERIGPPNGHARNGTAPLNHSRPSDEDSRSGHRFPAYGSTCPRRNPARSATTGSPISVPAGAPVSTPKRVEERKSARKLRNVPESGVRNENGVRRGPGNLASAVVALALAVAASFTGANIGTGSQEQIGTTPWIWDISINGGTEQESGSSPPEPTGGVRLTVRDDMGIGRSRRNVPSENQL